MAQNRKIVGIDIAKDKADACIRALAQRLTAPSTPQGQGEMIAWLRAHDVGTAVMEASGGYERAWATALRETGFKVRIVDPKRVRHFAKSAGRLAKNDPIDAEMIAWFAETFEDDIAPPHDPAREQLDLLVSARTSLVNLRTQIENHSEHRQPRAAAQAFAAIAKVLATQLARLEAAIAAALKANPGFAERAAIIASIPGLGAHTVAGLVAWFPELGRISNKAAAALLGVAPYDDDSGKHRSERHIKGGRQEIRNLFYMAVLGAATRHNPVLKAHYVRLRAKGKEAKSLWWRACAN